MKICHFGNYAENTRGRTLIKALGLIENVDFLNCCSDKKGTAKFFNLFYKAIKTNKKKIDIVFITFPGQLYIIIAKLFFRKPIILDSFISLYNTDVEDRGFHKKNSIIGRYYFFLDWLSVRLADKIILDTEFHINYFTKKFQISKDKFFVVPVGTDEDIFYPRVKNKNKNFIVSFHGSYIPLHGVDYIIEAANILKDHNDIEFRLLGTGQTLKESKKQVEKYSLKNIFFKEERIPYEKLPDFINEGNVCLGIFGKTVKADMVVPNKLFECLAMKKIIITGRTKAVDRWLVDGDNIFMVNRDDSSSLAKKIIEIKNNYELSEKVAENGYQLFKQNFTLQKILDSLLKVINYGQ